MYLYQLVVYLLEERNEISGFSTSNYTKDNITKSQLVNYFDRFFYCSLLHRCPERFEQVNNLLLLGISPCIVRFKAQRDLPISIPVSFIQYFYHERWSFIPSLARFYDRNVGPKQTTAQALANWLLWQHNDPVCNSSLLIIAKHKVKANHFLIRLLGNSRP